MNSSSLPTLQHYITNKGEQLMNSSSLPMNSSSLPTLQHYITNKGEHLMNSSSLPTLQYYITNKGEQLMNSSSLPTLQHYSRFTITTVIVLESSYLFLTEGMFTSGYITVNVTKRLKN